jgi:hypothetical protein
VTRASVPPRNATPAQSASAAPLNTQANKPNTQANKLKPPNARASKPLNEQANKFGAAPLHKALHGHKSHLRNIRNAAGFEQQARGSFYDYEDDDPFW